MNHNRISTAVVQRQQNRRSELTAKLDLLKNVSSEQALHEVSTSLWRELNGMTTEVLTPRASQYASLPGLRLALQIQITLIFRENSWTHDQLMSVLKDPQLSDAAAHRKQHERVRPNQVKDFLISEARRQLPVVSDPDAKFYIEFLISKMNSLNWNNLLGPNGVRCERTFK